MTGPNPVDRGKSGSKIHVLSDRVGLPLSVAVSAANTNDADALKPLVRAIPAIKSRRGPRRRKPDKLHADKERLADATDKDGHMTAVGTDGKAKRCQEIGAL